MIPVVLAIVILILVVLIAIQYRFIVALLQKQTGIPVIPPPKYKAPAPEPIGKQPEDMDLTYTPNNPIGMNGSI